MTLTTPGKSLYIHTPFCRKKCPYCHFYVAKYEEDRVDRFTDLIIMELETKVFTQELSSIYFGGGTPYLLGSNNIARILAKCPKAKEITLEANPEDVTYETMKDFKEAGINRVSIGVQSFDDSLLKLLGRNHSGEKAKKAVTNTFEAGIHNITIDLMYDVPNQTRGIFKKSLETVADLPISHLSLYNLTIEPFTPFHKKKSALEVLRPTSEDSALMLKDAIFFLEEMGLSRYEISAFAKKGFESIHNTGYWEGRPFHGVGPSAFSYIDGARFQNVCNIKTYEEKVSCGKDPVDFYEKLEPLKRDRELLMTGIRMSKGICKTRFKEALRTLTEEIQELTAQGCIVMDGNYIKLTEKGMLFYDDVAAELI